MSASQLAPGVRVAGTIAPPCRVLTAIEGDSIVARIRMSWANLVSVERGLPKRDLWMHHIRERQTGVTLPGLGAAFHLLNGPIPQSQEEVRDPGLESFYRVWSESRRLWGRHRHLFDNPASAVLAAARATQFRVKSLPRE